jgi:uncharacterized protein YoxC
LVFIANFGDFRDLIFIFFVSVMLTSILSLVSTIEKGLKKVLSQFDGLKNVLRSLTSRLVTVEKDVNTCSAKVTELESNIQGVSNLFDNLYITEFNFVVYSQFTM